MRKYPYTNSQMAALIAEHIHIKRDREILLAYFIDGVTYEQIAETHDLSVRWTAKIIRRGKDTLLPLLLQ